MEDLKRLREEATADGPFHRTKGGADTQKNRRKHKGTSENNQNSYVGAITLFYYYYLRWTFHLGWYWTMCSSSD